MSDAPTATARTGEPHATGIPPWLSQLGRNPLVPLMIAGAAAIALVVALLLWATKPEYRVLFSNLTEADGGRIIAELEQRGVPYRFSSGGQALLVPGDQVHALRLRLAEQGLPAGGNVGFEIMDNQAFGVSQFTEQVNFQRALEGQLAASIEALGPVAGARVHLAMARPSVFVREHQPAKASVVVTLQPGRTLGDGQVSAIVHLVSSSVPDLAAEAVTVVDQQGNLLSRRDTDGSGLDGSRLAYTRQIELAYQQRILDILIPVLGTDNVRAQVTVDIDFSNREETSERYAPNQDDNPAAVRSAQTRTAFTGGEAVARGVPGALTNVPPGAAASPVEVPVEENADVAGDAEALPGNLQRDDLINYEVDRHITHVQHGRGRVQRLSAAVVVNHATRLDEDGEPVQEPLPQETLDRLESLARQAMGFSEARGDELALVNSPFTPEAAADELEQAWWQSSEMQHLALSLARYLVVLIVALLVYRSLVRPLVQRASEERQKAIQAQQQPVEPSFTAIVGDTNAAMTGYMETAEGDAGADEDTGRRRRRSTGYEQNLQDFKRMAEEDPALIAVIVRNWIAQYD